MVQNTFGIIIDSVYNSFNKSNIKLLAAPQLMTTKVFDKTNITPLMAKPYEIVNVTDDNNNSTPVVVKPPDQPNG